MKKEVKETKVIEMKNENVNAEVQQDTVTVIEDKKPNYKKIGKIIGGVAAAGAVVYGVVKIVAGIGKKGSGHDEGCVAADADFEPTYDCVTEE